MALSQSAGDDADAPVSVGLDQVARELIRALVVVDANDAQLEAAQMVVNRYDGNLVVFDDAGATY